MADILSLFSKQIFQIELRNWEREQVHGDPTIQAGCMLLLFPRLWSSRKLFPQLTMISKQCMLHILNLEFFVFFVLSNMTFWCWCTVGLTFCAFNFHLFIRSYIYWKYFIHSQKKTKMSLPAFWMLIDIWGIREDPGGQSGKLDITLTPGSLSSHLPGITLA